MFLKNIIGATEESSNSHKIVEQFIIIEYIYMNKLFFTTVPSVSFCREVFLIVTPNIGMHLLSICL